MPAKFDPTKWYRTCQECGHQQNCDPPSPKALVEGLTPSYRNAKCRRCKSESLDYGRYMVITAEEEEASECEPNTNSGNAGDAR